MTSRQNVPWGSGTGVPGFVLIDSFAVSSLLLRAHRRQYLSKAWVRFRLLSRNYFNAEIMQVTVCFVSLHCISMYTNCIDRN
jgi:hypothetical protein